MSHQGLTHTLLRKNTCDDFYMGNAFPLKILHYFVSFCDVGQEVWRKLMPCKEPTSEPGEQQFEPSYPGHRLMSIGCFDISLKWAIHKERKRNKSHTDCPYSSWGSQVHQGYILSPCLCTLYAEYIMGNAGSHEAQAGIKIAGSNINNLRYAVDITLLTEIEEELKSPLMNLKEESEKYTTLMAGSEEELKSLLIKVKEESEKVGLKLNIQKTTIMASGSITSGQIGGKTMETVRDFTFWI